MSRKASPKSTARPREDRLKAALKANLARRKAQSRARGVEQAAQTGQGTAAGTPGPDGQNKDA